MRDEDLVWYVGYGSNLLKERFLCYITGGQPEGSLKTHEGCRDPRLPRDDKPILLNYELYFSKNSRSWHNGGVGFINTDASAELSTFGRMYLVTKQQLEDIAKQENDSEDFVILNFEEVITNGHTIFKSPSWYGKLLYLGEYNQYPVFTLTNETDLTVATKPGVEYLQTIVKGIRQTHQLSIQELVDYFIRKRGISVNYTADELQDLIENVAGENAS